MTIRINTARLLESVAELARIGASEGGGVTRLTLSDEDKAARDLLTTWMTEAGLDVRIDDLGNMTGVRRGSTDAPPVILASHIDSVVKGGRYDGALGVLAALEVVRTLNDNGIETAKPLAVVNWTNEEGVRFEPALLCSGAVAGAFDVGYVNDRVDRDGKRFGDELDRIGYRGEIENRPGSASAYLELHIEQGPVLEADDLPVGIVGGIFGLAWSEVTITGKSDHAGPSPMHLRRDPLIAAAEIIQGVERIATMEDDIAVATVGRVAVEPNVINTIPGKVVFSVDFRHPDESVLDTQVSRLEALVEHVCSERKVEGKVDTFWRSRPTPFDPAIVAAIRDAVRVLGLGERDLWSGAAHDAKYMADIVPSGMIFVRSQGGLSHAEGEYSTPEDIEAGANVLLLAALQLSA
ncbi:MAG: Zn-dependent hydrolase [Thermomicrobiales bacterium]|nr:Zn-dependent hydrolase [Thermomicrobiales bacterium]